MFQLFLNYVLNIIAKILASLSWITNFPKLFHLFIEEVGSISTFFSNYVLAKLFKFEFVHNIKFAQNIKFAHILLPNLRKIQTLMAFSDMSSCSVFILYCCKDIGWPSRIVNEIIEKISNFSKLSNFFRHLFLLLNYALMWEMVERKKFTHWPKILAILSRIVREVTKKTQSHQNWEPSNLFHMVLRYVGYFSSFAELCVEVVMVEAKKTFEHCDKNFRLPNIWSSWNIWGKQSFVNIP